MAEKMIPAVCTQCGAHLTIDPGCETTVCPYCGTEFYSKSGVEAYNIQINQNNNTYIHNEKKGIAQSAFEFFDRQYERADRRMREERLQKQKAQERDEKIGKVILYAFGLLFLFPITATILIVKYAKFPPKVKYGLIAAIWIITAGTFISAGRENARDLNGIKALLTDNSYEQVPQDLPYGSFSGTTANQTASGVSYKYVTSWNEIYREIQGGTGYSYTLIDPDIMCEVWAFAQDEDVVDPWSTLDTVFNNVLQGDSVIAQSYKRVTINEHPAIITRATINSVDWLVTFVMPDKKHLIYVTYTDSGEINTDELKNYLALLNSISVN